MTAAIDDAPRAVTPISLPRSVASNGIAWHAAGDGPPMVLIHGVGLVAESWLPQIEGLKSSFALYAVDMPGHGGSAGLDDRQAGLAAYTGKIREFIDEVIDAPVLLAGQSIGAMIALDLASSSPGLCRGVAALNTIYKRSPEAGRAVRSRAEAILKGPAGDIASAPVRRWFGEHPSGPDKEMAGHCRCWLNQMDRPAYATAYAAFARADGPSDAALSAMSMPALFLTGDGDENSTPAMARAMAGLAPHGTAKIIAGARHMSQLSHGAEVSAALTHFFNRIET